MLIPICVLAVKEIFMLITGYMIIKKCDIVLGADWHGKAATVLLSFTMALHLFWHKINPIVSIISIILSTGMLLLTTILYAKRNFGYLLKK